MNRMRNRLQGDGFSHVPNDLLSEPCVYSPPMFRRPHLLLTAAVALAIAGASSMAADGASPALNAALSAAGPAASGYGAGAPATSSGPATTLPDTAQLAPP